MANAAMVRSGVGWTDEDEQTLRSLWGSAMSASQIGELMGRNRNSIIGKAHRLKLPAITGRGPGRPLTRVAKGPRKIRLRPVKQAALPKPKPVIARKVVLDEPVSLDLTLTQLEAFQCRWATNDGGPFLFCGHPVEGHTPYCAHHLFRSFIAGPAPRAKPSRWFGWRSAA
jgi:GcrA cell cycle regulator